MMASRTKPSPLESRTVALMRPTAREISREAPSPAEGRGSDGGSMGGLGLSWRAAGLNQLPLARVERGNTDWRSAGLDRRPSSGRCYQPVETGTPPDTADQS